MKSEEVEHEVVKEHLDAQLDNLTIEKLYFSADGHTEDTGEDQWKWTAEDFPMIIKHNIAMICQMC